MTIKAIYPFPGIDYSLDAFVMCKISLYSAYLEI